MLRELDLSGTRVSDIGLMRLAGIPSLRIIRVRSTTVTDAGIAAATKANPILSVTR
jgi:hypothetical protein